LSRPSVHWKSHWFDEPFLAARGRGKVFENFEIMVIAPQRLQRLNAPGTTADR